MCDTVAGGQRRAELGFVGIGRFMQIDMHEQPAAQWGDQAHQRSGFGRTTAVLERAVGVDGLRVPAMNDFVGPGADTGRDQQIDPAGIAFRPCVEKLQCPMYATGFIAVHATGYQGTGQRVVPVAALERKKWIAVRPIFEPAVLDDLVA